MNAQDRARIAQAVAKAEAGTSGEIVCVLAQECSAYREVPLAWAAALVLLLPPLLAPVRLWPLAWPGGGEWSTGAQAVSPTAAVEVYALAQILLFVAAWLLASIPAVRRILTPGALKSHRVHRVAMQQFLATGMASDPARTGVMILGSLHDRRVEVLAEAGINGAVGGDAAWAAAVAAVQAGMRRGDLASGFADAARLCGEVLARHFPIGEADNPNTVPDELIEI
ncbi:MAG: TPM domain-containing protein [Caulobacteraceae bacterium]|nr:TPM domain-containing protein [Caulobacter sp.]